MELSLVILNYKSRELVKQCLKAILRHPPSCSYEIIVVDNASGDGTGEMLTDRFPQARFIQAPTNGGFASGNNLGIRASRGRYVTLMNPDITVREGAFDAMIAYMDAHKDVGALGPRLLRPDGSVDESCYRFPTPMIPVYRRTPLGKTAAGKKALAEYLMEDFDRHSDRRVDWVLGAVLMARREAIDKVGLLDERFFLYFEDTDWCRRFWEAGYAVVYLAGAEMVHYHERLSARGPWFLSPFRASTRIHIASAVNYFAKWRKGPVCTSDSTSTTSTSSRRGPSGGTTSS